LKKNWD